MLSCCEEEARDSRCVLRMALLAARRRELRGVPSPHSGRTINRQTQLRRRRRWQEIGSQQSKPDDPSPTWWTHRTWEKREEARDHSKAPRLGGEVGSPGTRSTEG